MTLDRRYVGLPSVGGRIMFISSMMSAVRVETEEALALGLGRTDACVDFVHDLQKEPSQGPLSLRKVLKASGGDVISARG